MRLEIGAGENQTPGYIHQDIRALPGIDIICDAFNLSLHVKKESCSEIRACHVLEHFSYRDTDYILKEWAKCLKPGGIIHIEVPNFDWQTRSYANGIISDNEAIYYIFGEQDYRENFHKTGFTINNLNKFLCNHFNHVIVDDIGMVLIGRGIKP